MTFNLIQKRTSVRTFKQEPLTEEDIKWIQDIINEVNNDKGPNGNSVQFSLLGADPNNDGNIAGTYGFIRNPQSYIAGSVPADNPAIEDYGYLLEKIIVRLVARDIGSCWLGGTFRRSDFENPLGLKPDHLIPAVIPIGYPVNNRRSVEKVMRFFVKADKRRKWTDLFYLGTFDNAMDYHDLDKENSLLLSAFGSVHVAPSASNKQPWRLVFSPPANNVHFYLNEDPGYNGNKLGFKMQRLDAGIAMYHFDAVAAENGFNGKWAKEDPGLVPPNTNMKYIMTYSW